MFLCPAKQQKEWALLVWYVIYLFLCFVLFFLQEKLNEGVCMQYHDFHSLVEQTLGEKKSNGSTEKARKADSG